MLYHLKFRQSNQQPQQVKYAQPQQVSTEHRILRIDSRKLLVHVCQNCTL